MYRWSPNLEYIVQSVVTMNPLKLFLRITIVYTQGAVEYSWELVAADPPENRKRVVIVCITILSLYWALS